MISAEYESARLTLGWSHERLRSVIGVSERTIYRNPMPKPAARLLRALVWVKLTESDHRFEILVAELERL